MRERMALKAEGRIEEARQHGLSPLGRTPQDTDRHDEVASLHDRLGREREAIPLYHELIALGLAGNTLRGALLGLRLGSSCPSQGGPEARVGAVATGRGRVFPALVHDNLGRHKEACEARLALLAQTTQDPALIRYARHGSPHRGSGLARVNTPEMTRPLMTSGLSEYGGPCPT